MRTQFWIAILIIAFDIRIVIRIGEQYRNIPEPKTGVSILGRRLKPSQINDLSDPGVRRDVAKGGDMKISPENVGQCWGFELASLANLVIA
jgi:hypothetical protein